MEMNGIKKTRLEKTGLMSFAENGIEKEPVHNSLAYIQYLYFIPDIHIPCVIPSAIYTDNRLISIRSNNNDVYAHER